MDDYQVYEMNEPSDSPNGKAKQVIKTDDYQTYKMNEPSDSPNNSKTNMGCGTWIVVALAIFFLLMIITKLAYD